MHKWLIKKEKTIDPTISTVTAQNEHTNNDMSEEPGVKLKSNIINNVCFEKVTQTKGKKLICYESNLLQIVFKDYNDNNINLNSLHFHYLIFLNNSLLIQY